MATYDKLITLGRLKTYDGKVRPLIGTAQSTADAAQSTANAAKTAADSKQDKLTAGDNITIKDNVISAAGSGGSGVPVGTVIAYAGKTLPEGWLFCDGLQYDVETYPKLYAVLGKGTTPDLTNRFVLGSDDTNSNLLATGGSATHVLTLDEVPAHSHTPSAGSDRSFVTVAGAGTGIERVSIKPGTSTATSGILRSADNAIYRNAVTSTVGGGKAFSVMPPYCVLAYIVYAGEPASVAVNVLGNYGYTDGVRLNPGTGGTSASANYFATGAFPIDSTTYPNGFVIEAQSTYVDGNGNPWRDCCWCTYVGTGTTFNQSSYNETKSQNIANSTNSMVIASDKKSLVWTFTQAPNAPRWLRICFYGTGATSKVTIRAREA